MLACRYLLGCSEHASWLQDNGVVVSCISCMFASADDLLIDNLNFDTCQCEFHLAVCGIVALCLVHFQAEIGCLSIV